MTGNVSYSPSNNEMMVRLRARKIAGIAREVPPTQVFGDAQGGDLAGGWMGLDPRHAARGGGANTRAKGKNVSHVHLRYLNPLPSDFGDILRRFKKVMVAEMNMGQLLKMISGPTTWFDAFGHKQDSGPAVQGQRD